MPNEILEKNDITKENWIGKQVRIVGETELVIDEYPESKNGDIQFQGRKGEYTRVVRISNFEILPMDGDFIYRYQNTPSAQKEKEVLQIAKKAVIEKFGEKIWFNEAPFQAESNDDTWLVSGTLYSEKDGKRYRNGQIGDDGNRVAILGGTVEVNIANNNMEVLGVYHTK